MARAADPAGKRTVGIITKCDALQTGDEQGVSTITGDQRFSLMPDRFFALPKMRLNS
jgi:hypothetical protein